MKILLATIIAALCFAHNCEAEVSEAGMIISMRGDIDRQMLADVKAFFDSAPSCPFISLDSLGGDVFSAIAIGRMLRAHRCWALVQPDATCASSCVLILAGAVKRTVNGPIAIHRPYGAESNNGQSFSDTKIFYDKMQSTIKSYLQEMNVSPTLWDDMAAIPPSEGRHLSDQEMKKDLLLDIDPVEEEIRRQQGAAKLGISIKESVNRKALVEQLCKGTGTEYPKCESTIMAGK